MLRGQLRAFTFRFLSAWLLLYWQGICLILTPVVGGQLYRTYYEPIWNAPTRWFAMYALGMDHPVPNHLAEGSDTQYYWTRDLLFAVLAILVALVWTAARRQHRPTGRAWGWLWLAMRLVLGMQMSTYGAAKLFPAQMPELMPSQLLTRIGDQTPMQVLWHSMSAAPLYESVTGFVELSSGILLALPGVWPLGAALAVIAMGQVTLLDLFYDVPVKLHCTHLLAMAVILLLPHAPRLWDVLVANRATLPLPKVSLTGKQSRDRAVAAAAALIVAVFAAGALTASYTAYSLFGPDRPKPQFYGAWKARGPAAVGYFVVDGYDPEALFAGADLQHAKVSVVFELADGSVQRLGAQIDRQGRQLVLVSPKQPGTRAALRYEELGPDQIKLSGERLGPPFELVFDRVRLDQLPLVKDRGVHWVDEAPVEE